MQRRTNAAPEEALSVQGPRNSVEPRVDLFGRAAAGVEQHCAGVEVAAKQLRDEDALIAARVQLREEVFRQRFRVPPLFLEPWDKPLARKVCCVGFQKRLSILVLLIQCVLIKTNPILKNAVYLRQYVRHRFQVRCIIGARSHIFQFQTSCTNII